MKPSMDELVQATIAEIEGQNWTDHPLTDDEKHLIDMALRSVLGHLTEGGAGG